jgi:hypothetical protein
VGRPQGNQRTEGNQTDLEEFERYFRKAYLSEKYLMKKSRNSMSISWVNLLWIPMLKYSWNC